MEHPSVEDKTDDKVEERERVEATDRDKPSSGKKKQGKLKRD